MVEIQSGIDLVEVARVRKSVENPRFLSRYFSEGERAIFAQKPNAHQTVAAHFAAKEAFAKALGTGVRGFALCEIEILRNELGAPFFVFSGGALALVQKMGYRFSLSITHTREYAAAVVTAYRELD